MVVNRPLNKALFLGGGGGIGGVPLDCHETRQANNSHLFDDYCPANEKQHLDLFDVFVRP